MWKNKEAHKETKATSILRSAVAKVCIRKKMCLCFQVKTRAIERRKKTSSLMSEKTSVIHVIM